MNIIIEESKQQALDLNTLKSHLRIDHEHEDAYLKEVISMSTDILERNIEKPILEKTFKFIHYNAEYETTRPITLPMSNIREIISVKKLVPGRSPEVLKYTLETHRDKTKVIVNGSKYPIEITYKAGITRNIKHVPKDLQFAILQISKNIYECSEEDVLESKYIKHIVNTHRTISLS